MASFAAATALPRLIEGLEMAHDTPVEEIVNKIYEFWKSHTFINFVKDVSYTMRPILLIKGFPNEKYKDFLSYFAFNYLDYPKTFITSLFFSALEQNAITGTIRIVADDHDWELVRDKSSEKVFVDSGLLRKLKELSSIIPLILSDGKRVYGVHAKNAVINNTIIRMLSDKRPDKVLAEAADETAAEAADDVIENSKRQIQRQRNNNNTTNPSKRRRVNGGRTIKRKRKRHRKSNVTRRQHNKRRPKSSN
jgi:hypothetical protein